MTVGTGIFLIVVGAIIRYALNVEIAGIEEGTLGLILIIAGIVTLILGLISAPFRYWGMRRSAVTDPRADPRVDPRY
jgi:hypothetical protein